MIWIMPVIVKKEIADTTKENGHIYLS
jgi:hypothetical protein